MSREGCASSLWGDALRRADGAARPSTSVPALAGEVVQRQTPDLRSAALLHQGRPCWVIAGPSRSVSPVRLGTGLRRSPCFTCREVSRCRLGSGGRGRATGRQAFAHAFHGAQIWLCLDESLELSYSKFMAVSLCWRRLHQGADG